MLHYFAKSFFAPVLVSPRLLTSGDVDVYVINDRFVPIIDAKIIVDVYNFSSFIPITTHTYPCSVPALSSRKQDFTIELWNKPTYEIFVKFSLEANGVRQSPSNFVFPKPLKSVKGLTEPEIQASSSIFTTKDKLKYIPLTLYPRRGSRGASDIAPRPTFYQNYLAVRNTEDETGGKPIADYLRCKCY
jgi:hypothetical protein